MSDRTQAELLSDLKEMRNDLKKVSAFLVRQRERHVKATETYQNLVAKAEELMEGNRSAWRKAHTAAEKACGKMEEAHALLLDEQMYFDRITRMAQETEALLASSAPTPVKEAETQETKGQTLLEIPVQLLSGQILVVSIDSTHPVSSFADAFAQQHGYPPSATERMVFMILHEQDEKQEEADGTIFWSPEERHPGKTIADLDIRVLHLVIRPIEATPREKEEKMDLVRSILRKETRYSQYDTDQLFDMFSAWHLTWQPPAKGNRYITMKAFVDAHPDMFWMVSQEEQRQQMIESLRHWILEGAEQFAQDAEYEPDFVLRRQQAIHHLENRIAGGAYQFPFIKQRCLLYQQYILPWEMYMMGVPLDWVIPRNYQMIGFDHGTFELNMPIVDGIQWRV